MGGQRGGQGSADNKTEVSPAGRRDRGRRSDTVQELERLGRAATSFWKRLVERLERRERCGTRKDGTIREPVEIALHSKCGVLDQVVHVLQVRVSVSDRVSDCRHDDMRGAASEHVVLQS